MSPVLLLDVDLEPAGAAPAFLPFLPHGVIVARPPLGDAPPVGPWSAVIVTGSAASAAAPAPWVQRAADWLAQAVAHGVPTLGVCFGHQLLAHAVAPGSVVRRKRPEVGYLPVALASDPLLDALPRPLRPFISHEDEVRPDPRLQVLARSDACEVHAIRVPGRLAWGVQFHLEYPAAEQRRILTWRAARHPELDLDVPRLLADAPDLRPAAAALFDRFLALAAAARAP